MGYICPPYRKHQLRMVMELVDMLDLGSSAARRGGSTPFIRTKKAENFLGFFGTSLLQEFADF